KNFGGAIDVTLNEMPTHRRAGCDCAFEIYRTVAAYSFQICALERFVKKIESELPVCLRGHSETAAVHRHAVADRNFVLDLRRSQLQLPAGTARVERYDATDFLDQSREHGVTFSSDNVEDRHLVCSCAA